MISLSVTLLLSSPLGPLTLTQEGQALISLQYGDLSRTPGDTPLLRQAAAQLEEYFAGLRRTFELPLAPAGTPFQRRVWGALAAIPYGETRSYRWVAEQAGSPRAFRAVGMACHRNPLPIFLPCHRVVGAGGALTGYAGGLDKKTALLTLEGVHLVPGSPPLPHRMEKPGNPQNLIVIP